MSQAVCHSLNLKNARFRFFPTFCGTSEKDLKRLSGSKGVARCLKHICPHTSSKNLSVQDVHLDRLTISQVVSQRDNLCLTFERVHNRFGGTAGSAFFDGRDTGYAIPGVRDTG